MDKIKALDYKGIRVLTTKQIAEAYGTEIWKIQQNYRNNKGKYVLGKHYVMIEGEELKKLKRGCESKAMNEGENFSLVEKRASSLYLWTEKGALLHAKSLNTDKAWEVYDYLVDFYFRAKEVQREKSGEQREPARPLTRLVVDIPVNEQAQELIQEIEGNMAGMKSLIRMYNRYLTEENYKKVVYVMRDMCMEMSNIGFQLASVQPGMMEKKM